MGKILQFLFGKPPEIFNKKGAVQHDLGKKKWAGWSDRFAKDPNYDFTKHVGQSSRTEAKPK
ncbi:MAG: hypothetical protein IT287_02960 [Bdellovibrionaceae bacterium]|nr:hypothetical protein [Pseudobdellovibrionaceae bacterium]